MKNVDLTLMSTEEMRKTEGGFWAAFVIGWFVVNVIEMIVRSIND